MEGPLKELNKLESLTSSNAKGPSTQDTLDALLASLREAKDAIAAGGVDPARLQSLAKTVEGQKKDVEDKQKEVYSSMSKFGKAWDKVCILQPRISPNALLTMTRNSRLPCLPTQIFSLRHRLQHLWNERSLFTCFARVNSKLQTLSSM
mgnify:CR=1 FL=1